MVILVDKHDTPVGYSGKMEAHHRALLHRAISVFIFNSKGQMLLQQRAMGKYHSPAVWANACCSHPLPGESPGEAAVRRLKQELGLTARLTFRGAFLYKADVGNGLIEHEYDHMFSGRCDAAPSVDPEEVMAYKYVDIDDIRDNMAIDPDSYAVWFRIMFTNFYDHIPGWAK